MTSVADYRRIAIRDMSEAELQASVVDLAQRLGWRCYHTYDSRRSGPGFPDLMMVRNGRMVIAELKRQGRYPRPAQRAWLDDLRQVSGNITVAVWRPSDWFCGEIERILRGEE